MTSVAMNSLELIILMSLLTGVSPCGWGYSSGVITQNIQKYKEESRKLHYLTTGRRAFFTNLPFGKMILSFCANTTQVKECDGLMLEMIAKDLQDIYKNESFEALENTMKKFDNKLGDWFRRRTEAFRQDRDLRLVNVLSSECVAAVKQKSEFFPVNSDLGSQLSVPLNVTRGLLMNFMLRVLAVAVNNEYKAAHKKTLCEEAVNIHVFNKLYLQYQGLWMGDSYQGWVQVPVFFSRTINQVKYKCYSPLITKNKLSGQYVTVAEEKVFKGCYAKLPSQPLAEGATGTEAFEIRFGGVAVIEDGTLTQQWGRECVSRLKRIFNNVNFDKPIKYIPPMEDKNRMKNFLNLLFYESRGYLTGDDTYENRMLMCDYAMFQFLFLAEKSLSKYLHNMEPRKYDLSLKAAQSNPYSLLIESLCYGNQGYFCYFELSSDINPKVLNGSEVSNERFNKFKDHYAEYIKGRLPDFTEYLKVEGSWKLENYIPNKCLQLLRNKFSYFDMNVDLKARVINEGFGNLGYMSLNLIFGIMRYYYYNNKVTSVIGMNNKFCEQLLEMNVFLLLKVSFTFQDERSTTKALTPMFEFVSRPVCSDLTSSCQACLDGFYNPRKIPSNEIDWNSYKEWKSCSTLGTGAFQTFSKTLELKEDIRESMPAQCLEALDSVGLSYKVFEKFNIWDDSADTLYIQKLWKWGIAITFYLFKENPEYPLTKYVCETVVASLVRTSYFAFPELSEEKSSYNETNGLTLVYRNLCGDDSLCKAYYKKISLYESSRMEGLSREEYLSFVDCKSETQKRIRILDVFIRQKGTTWRNCFTNEGKSIFRGYPQFNLEQEPPGRGLISDFDMSVDFYIMAYESMCYYYSRTSIKSEVKYQTAQLLHKSRFAARFLRVVPSMDETFSGSDIV